MNKVLLRRQIKHNCNFNVSEGTPKIIEPKRKRLKIVEESIELGSNVLLRLFINFVHKGVPNHYLDKECAQFFNWMLLNKTAIENDNLGNFFDLTIKDSNQQNDEKSIPCLAYKLRGMLTILLLSRGDVAYVGQNNRTILHAFVENCCQDNGCFFNENPSKVFCMVKSLIKLGALVDLPNHEEDTPLHIAAKSQNVALISTLLGEVENVNVVNDEYDSILHLVVGHSGDVDLARELLRRGAWVQCNANGVTPIQLAAEMGRCEMLRVILETKPKVELEHDCLLTRLCRKIVPDEKEKIEVVDLLLRHGYDANGRYAKSPLHIAAENDCTELVDLLIRHGADVDGATMRNNLTPLHLAAKGAGRGTIEVLLVAGAGVDEKARCDVTPLHLAAMRNGMDVVECLLDGGANLECRESFFGFTALHMAALDNDAKKMQLLMSRGLDVNDGGKYGVTPLHMASFLGNVEVVRLLIESKANTSCRDGCSLFTPLHFTSIGGYIWDVVGRIAVGSNFERTGLVQPFWTHFWKEKERDEEKAEVVEILVESGVDVNAKDKWGRTPLHLATLDPKSIVVEKLLSLGAHIDEYDDEDNLPILNVLKSENIDRGLKHLLAFGVDVNEEHLSWKIMNSSTKVLKCVLEHVNKQRAARLAISKVYNSYLNHWTWRVHRDECRVEVSKMKVCKIVGDVTLYDLLFLKERRRDALLASQVKWDFEERFPIYFDVLRGCCSEAVRRRWLVERASLGLYRLSGFWLPDLCIDEIVKHLSNKCLKAFVS